MAIIAASAPRRMQPLWDMVYFRPTSPSHSLRSFFIRRKLDRADRDECLATILFQNFGDLLDECFVLNMQFKIDRPIIEDTREHDPVLFYANDTLDFPASRVNRTNPERIKLSDGLGHPPRKVHHLHIKPRLK